MAIVNVLKYLKRKKSGNYEEPVYIGAEQRFVDAMRGTSNGNLEEQSILGSDFIATSYWINETTFVIRQEFRKETTTSGYYVLEIYKYSESGGGQFSEDELLIDSDKVYFRDISMIITDDQAQFRGTAPDSDVLIPSESLGNLTPLPGEENGYLKTQEEILSYVGQNGTTRISIKALYKKEEDGKTYTKSVISRVG